MLRFPCALLVAVSIVSVAVGEDVASPAVPGSAGSWPDLSSIYDKVASANVVVVDDIKDPNSRGSGVIVHKDGFIVTAAHVIAQGNQIGVEFYNGEKTTAKIVTFSRSQDLPLLKVGKLPDHCYIAPLADSDHVKPGRRVFCIGAPRGLNFSMSFGIVSAVRRNVGNRFKIFSPVDLIQTDAAMNPGNSGGALFTMDGKVAGIASKIISQNRNFAGVGLAVPSNIVRERLFENALPYIGVHLQRISPNLAAVMNWPPLEGLLVERVQKGSAAEKAGLQGGRYLCKVGTNIELVLGGDVIYEVGGIPVADSKKVHTYLHSLKKGDKIEYRLFREGRVVSLEIPIDDFEPIPTLPPLPKTHVVAKPVVPAPPQAPAKQPITANDLVGSWRSTRLAGIKAIITGVSATFTPQGEFTMDIQLKDGETTDQTTEKGTYKLDGQTLELKSETETQAFNSWLENKTLVLEHPKFKSRMYLVRTEGK